ncbi:KpsF/GutQ family sugar-phosphate isomerase [candidate division KSB1 bacterium]|nr:KpsF/GutQ family sugar-phosphate isomerase [candidate division KSB1 bacterium]
MTDKECIEKGKEVVRKESEAIIGLMDKIDSSFVRVVNTIYNSKGRVVISGMGKSGLIGKKIVATLTSTGTAAVFLHPAEAVHGDLGILGKNDVFLCISKSGDTHELTSIIPIVKRLGAIVITMTGNMRSRLAQRSDIVLDVSVKEEACPNNLAPTSSSTAALVMGDAIAVALLAKRNFSSIDFALYHPGGILGINLSLLIDDIMFTEERIPLVHEDTDLEKVILEITSKRFGSTCVINQQGELTGIITDGDIRRLLENKGKDNLWELRAKDIMNRNPKIICAGELATHALKILSDFSIMQIIVIDSKNHPIGIVHLHDLLDAGIHG